jgi:hypothetical protein
MTTTAIKGIDTADLRCEASVEDDAVSVRLAGSAETASMAALEAMLREVHAAAVRVGAREVRVDLRRLEFMNSSCLKTFITWIGQVQELEAPRQYTVRFLSDDGKHWQRRSLGALSCFAVDLIRVET